MRKTLAGRLLRCARPDQWVKNLTCFLPVIFSDSLGDPSRVAHGLLAAGCFVGLSSSVYLLNDAADVERDRLHPLKRLRPIASGDLTVSAAVTTSAALALISLLVIRAILPPMGPCAFLYLSLNAAYSFQLREEPLVGEFCIALGFCLRVVAGILAIGSKRSPWIVLATFFLALFIAFGKRQSERAARHLASPRDPNPGRASLKEYTVGSLDLFLIGSGCLSILTYALFAILSAPTPDLILTVPFVVYGIFRYLSLVRNGPLGESPERLVLQDRALFLNSLLWLSTYLALAKMRVGFFER